MLINNAAIDHLLQRGIEYQLLRKKHDARQQVALSGYDMSPALIAQAQLMQDEHGVVLAITPHNRRLAPHKLQQLLERKMHPAASRLTRQLLHCDSLSAIAPLPLTSDLKAVVDSSLQQQQLICFEANDPTLLACVSVQAFMQLHHNSQWADISEEATTSETPAPATAQSASVGNLQQRLLSLRELPPANDLTRALLDIVKEPNASVEQLARVIETDAGLSAQLLRHARSPYYACGGQIDSVADAITRVPGFDTVLMTSLAIATGKPLQIPREGRIGRQALCRHSLYSAVLARSLTRHIPEELGVIPGTAYLTALLQNIGFLLLGHLLRPDYEQLSRAIEANPETPLLQLEEKTLGVNHAQIGSWLMRRWNMPDEIIVAIRQHHNLVYRGEHASYVKLIALVNTLLKRHNIGDSPNLHPLGMLLKALSIPEEKALAEVEKLLAQRDALNQLAITLSG